MTAITVLQLITVDSSKSKNDLLCSTTLTQTIPGLYVRYFYKLCYLT